MHNFHTWPEVITFLDRLYPQGYSLKHSSIGSDVLVQRRLFGPHRVGQIYKDGGKIIVEIF